MSDDSTRHSSQSARLDVNRPVAADLTALLLCGHDGPGMVVQYRGPDDMTLAVCNGCGGHWFNVIPIPGTVVNELEQDSNEDGDYIDDLFDDAELN